MMMRLFTGALALLLALQVALALDVGLRGRDQKATTGSSSATLSGMTAPTAVAMLMAALARSTMPEVGGHVLQASSEKAVTSGNEGERDITTGNGVALDITTTGSSGGLEVTVGPDIPSKTTGSGGVIAVGDTRYKWLAWSEWYCNCKMGSMSRMRDITYTEPGLQLDPEDYNTLRFQRVACSYNHCKCNHERHQCDHTTVICDEPNHYLCAVRDVQRARYLQAQRFWRRVRVELKGLRQSIQKALYQLKKENEENS